MFFLAYNISHVAKPTFFLKWAFVLFNRVMETNVIII